MLPDTLSVVVRALSFVTLFQAAGAAIFIAAFGRELTHSLADIRRAARLAALAGLVLVLAHYSLEAARMAGEMSGATDASLQAIVLHSTSGAMVAVRALGLLLIAVGLRRKGDWSTIPGVIGATLAVTSFALLGHTSVHSSRWVLAPMLIVHLLAVAFWFGALLPLYFVSKREMPLVAAKVIDAFSLVAVWVVPGILIAGLVMALLLIPRLGVLREPYGELLIAKLVGFAVLMGFAATNKWRFGPAIARGEARAAQLLRRSVAAEYVLISAVLAITAVMTSFFSPEH
jgi:putative copper resistance protein D